MNMLKLKKILLSVMILSLMVNTSYAKKDKGNSTLDRIVQKVALLTQTDYLYDKSLKGKYIVTKNFKLTKENADKFLSTILNLNGYTRVRFGKNNFQIINSRDIRYHEVSSYTKVSDMPDSDDYVMFRYKLKEKRLAKDITRSFRPFMSRYGRIIAMNHIGYLIIQDTAPNIKRMMKIIAEVDVKLTDDESKKREDRREFNDDLKKLKAKHCPQTEK